MSVTFLERMNRSYKVTLSSDIKFKNDRGSHVETDMTNLTGQTFHLGSRSTANVRGNVAVMYEVIGVTNRGHPAHISVYFGPLESSEGY